MEGQASAIGAPQHDKRLAELTRCCIGKVRGECEVAGHITPVTRLQRGMGEGKRVFVPSSRSTHATTILSCAVLKTNTSASSALGQSTHRRCNLPLQYAVQHQLHLRLGEHLLQRHKSKAGRTHPHRNPLTKIGRHETLATASVATA